MAKVPLAPIGRPLDAFLGTAEADRNATARGDAESKLGERRATVHAGWGEKYVDRVHAKDKLTTRERLEELKARYEVRGP